MSHLIETDCLRLGRSDLEPILATQVLSNGSRRATYLELHARNRSRAKTTQGVHQTDKQDFGECLVWLRKLHQTVCLSEGLRRFVCLSALFAKTSLVLACEGRRRLACGNILHCEQGLLCFMLTLHRTSCEEAVALLQDHTASAVCRYRLNCRRSRRSFRSPQH